MNTSDVHAWISPCKHQVGTLLKRHTLVPSPRPPLHYIAGGERGQGNSLKCFRANFSARQSQSGGIPARGVWCHMPYVYWTKNSTDGIPVLWKSNMIKANAHCFTVVSPLPNVGVQNFGMWDMYNLAKASRSILKSIVNRQVEDWEASNSHTKDTTPLFHGQWHDPVGEHICAPPFRMWNRLRFHRSHKYFRDAKAMQINRILKIS